MRNGVYMLLNGNLVLISDDQLYYTVSSYAGIKISFTKGVFKYMFEGAAFLSDL